MYRGPYPCLCFSHLVLRGVSAASHNGCICAEAADFLVIFLQQAIIDSLKNILLLLKEWHEIEVNPLSPLTPGNTDFDIYHLEGAGLCFLGSTEWEIRTLAIEILLEGSELHKAVKSRQSSESTLSVVEQESSTPTRGVSPEAFNNVNGKVISMLCPTVAYNSSGCSQWTSLVVHTSLHKDLHPTDFAYFDLNHTYPISTLRCRTWIDFFYCVLYIICHIVCLNVWLSKQH